MARTTPSDPLKANGPRPARQEGWTSTSEWADPPTAHGQTLPRWYQAALVVVTAIVVGVGGLGLLLADVGSYRFATAVGGGLAIAAGLSVVAWPRAPRAARRARLQRGSTWAAVAMCLLAVAFAGWNARDAGHHVAIGRDPGVYADTGRWIATHGNLEVHDRLEWSTKSPDVTPVFGGSYAVGQDVTEFQFDHFTPVLLAEADNLGGEGLLFRTPAVLAALALCAVYAMGCRLVRRPWLVLAAVAALGISLPQLDVARDTFSEPAVELLLWSGMWLLVTAYQRRRPGLALLAGAALVGTTMSRIDGIVYLVPLPLLAGLVWAATPPGRRWLLKLYGAFLVAAIPVAALSTFDVARRAGHYYSDLGTQVRDLHLGLALSAALGLVVVLLAPLARRHARPVVAAVNQRRPQIALGAAVLVALAAIVAWGVRPHVMHPHGVAVPLIGGLQHLEGLPFDPSRTYAESSVVWLSWYLGPPIIALALLGGALAVARICRRPEPALAVVLAVAGIGTALYLWNPSIVPDQIWAMRRFVPAALPLMVLLAALALSILADWLGVVTNVTRPVLVVGAIALVVFPLATTWPVHRFRPQAGYLAGVEATCRATGPRAALVTAADDPLSAELVGALQTWCNVPVATMTQPFTAASARHLAAQWAQQGRQLWVVATSPAAITASAPGASPRAVGLLSSPTELEVTLQRPPQYYSPVSQPIFGAPVAG